MPAVCPKHNVERYPSGYCPQCDEDYRSRNKDRIKLRRKKYYDAHKDKEKLLAKTYRSEHKKERRLYVKKWRGANKDKERLYGKKYRDANQDKVKLCSKKYYEEHKEQRKLYQKKNFNTPSGKMKYRARAAVHRAIKTGKLVRHPCQVCNAPKSEAHHHRGYAEEYWLDVVFLCPTHHRLADQAGAVE